MYVLLLLFFATVYATVVFTEKVISVEVFCDVAVVLCKGVCYCCSHRKCEKRC